MISTISTMMTCRWSARRIQRYLDADPAAPLAAAEVARLQGHLATCEKCTAAAEEYRGVTRALSRWASLRTPTPMMVARVRLAAQRQILEEAG